MNYLSNSSKQLLSITIIVLLLSCNEKDPKKLFQASFPQNPANFTKINSEYDDYNSAAPPGTEFPLCFSSTRNSKGANFSLIYKLLSFTFDNETGSLNYGEIDLNNVNLNYVSKNSNINDALNKINSEFDEFGPYLLPQGEKYTETNIYKLYQSYLFLYSNNSNGNQDIKFTQNLNDVFYENPKEIKFLNSEFDDAYPSFNKDLSELYFTSNRNKNFDIYKTSIDKKMYLVDFLTNTNNALIIKDSILSSDYDDKCPFIYNNIIVFTSNRPGGFGGYDLYFSHFISGKWTTPQNFGERINTAYDEYRPIIKGVNEFENDLMIFSSNRLGGLGGFDLYYVGISKVNN